MPLLNYTFLLVIALAFLPMAIVVYMCEDDKSKRSLKHD